MLCVINLPIQTVTQQAHQADTTLEYRGQASTTKRKASKAGRCLTDTGSGTQQITDTNSLARGRWKLEQSVLAD